MTSGKSVNDRSLPGGLVILVIPALIFDGSSDLVATAATNETNTASNASLVPELNVVPPILARNNFENSGNDDPDLTLPEVEWKPGTAASLTWALPPQPVSESPPYDREASHFPVRCSGPTEAQRLVEGDPAGWLFVDFCANWVKLVPLD